MQIKENANPLIKFTFQCAPRYEKTAYSLFHF